MTGRVELRKEYKEQTGEDWKMLNPTAQPTIEYVKWLESKLLAIHNVVGQSEQLVCESCGTPDSSIQEGRCSRCWTSDSI